MTARTLTPGLALSGLVALGLTVAGPARADLPFVADFQATITADNLLSPTEEETFLAGTSTNAPYGFTTLASHDLLLLSNGGLDYTYLPGSTFTLTDTAGDALFGEFGGGGGFDALRNTQQAAGMLVVTGGTGKYAGFTGGGTFGLMADGNGTGPVRVVASFVPAVPEPSSFALLALGLLPVGLTARRRRA